MNTSFLVVFFFIISIMVFLTALYIIIPISLLKKGVTLKQKPNQDGDRLLKKEEERTGKLILKHLNKDIENN